VTFGSILFELEGICGRTSSMIGEAFILAGNSKDEDDKNLSLEFKIAKMTALYLLSNGVGEEEMKSFMARHDWFLPTSIHKRQSND
jgi:hypothetical protein